MAAMEMDETYMAAMEMDETDSNEEYYVLDKDANNFKGIKDFKISEFKIILILIALFLI